MENQHYGEEAMSRKSAPVRASRASAPVAKRGEFDEVLALIQGARHRAYQAVNTELVGLYWQIGEYISRKLESAEWGDGVVAELARHIAEIYPGLRGFTRPNLFRMRQFYEAYAANEIVSTVLRQLSWSHHLTILSRAKQAQEREFYIRLAIHERWSVRELERQIKSGRFADVVLGSEKVTPLVTQLRPEAAEVFRDSYTLEFLSLPESHSEADLHGALIRDLGRFLTELGRGFCYIGSRYPLQVGKQDFFLDLLLFHRGLNCLVAIELKAMRFEPEHLGKLNFYVEALDRDHKLPHENPAIGLLLCATKDSEVVEYALNRSLSPTMIAEYKTQLPDEKLLRAKLHEFYQTLAADRDGDAAS